MKKIRLLVVDNEQNACEELISMLRKYSGLEIAGSAKNGQEALQILEEGNIDAVFLDIEMPVLNGLELANILSTWPNPPRIVFVTAYHQYAIEAFETNAIDYVLKPYHEDRIAKAIKKINAYMAQGPAGNEPLQGLVKNLFATGLIKKVVVRKKNSKDRIILDAVEFDFFHAKFAEVFARTAGQDYIVNMTLKDLGESLVQHGFAPCHKAYLINLSRVEKISPLFSGNFEILLKDGVKVPLSRHFAKAIREKVGGW